MTSLAELFTPHALVFTLVLARIGGMAVTAPLFSAAAVPAPIRAILALALAVIVAPAQLDAPVAGLTTAADCLIAFGVEALVGMALGLGAAILISAAQLAGQLIAQAGGLALAEVFDPGLGAEVPVLSQLLYFFALSIYLVVGGHRLLVSGLLDTFAALPLGAGRLPGPLADTLVTLVTESFSLSIRAAAPAIIALLTATIIIGMISRTLPHLNVLTLGFGLNTIVAFGALALALGSVAWLFEDQIQPTMSLVLRAIVSPARAASVPS